MSPVGRIVMLGCDPQAPGGISTVLRHYQASSLPRQWPLQMVSTWHRAGMAARLGSASLAAARLWSMVATDKVQAVHVHVAARGSFWRKWVLLQPVWARGIPVVLHVHDGFFIEWWTQGPARSRALVRGALEKASCVLALDEGWRAQLQDLAPGARVEVLPNPVELLTPPAAPRRGRLLFLSRLWPAKGIDDLLQACAHLRQPFELVCVGDGDLPAIRGRAQELGVAERVQLRGWLQGSARQEELRVAQLMVMPSHAEGQPLAVLEALAAGVPVVASRVGGLPALLAGGAGVLVPPKNPPALAAALDALLADPTRCRAMGERGRLHVEQHHAREAVAQRLSAIYRDIGLSESQDAAAGLQEFA